MKRIEKISIGLCVIVGLWVTCVLVAHVAPFELFDESSTSSNGNNPGEDDITLLDSISVNRYTPAKEERFNTRTFSPQTGSLLNPPLGTGDNLILETQQVIALSANPSSSQAWMINDLYENYEIRNTPFSGSRSSTSGDFNGDGRDELMAIDTNGLAIMYTDLFNNPHEIWQHQFSFGSGNYFIGAVDSGGNGTDILAVMRCYQVDFEETTDWYAHWEIYDVKNNAPLPLSNRDWSDESGTGNPYSPCGFLAGDYDGDTREELLVVIGSFCCWYLFDDALAKNAGNNPAPYLLMDSGSNLIYTVRMYDGDMRLTAVVGDTDGDRRKEVVYTSMGGGSKVLYIFDWSVEFKDLLRFDGYTRPRNYCFSLNGGDIDNDGLIEILTVQGDSYNPASSTLFAYDDPLHSYAQLLVVAATTGGLYLPADVAAADVNCDGIDEIVIVANNGTSIYGNALQNFALLNTNGSRTMAQPRIVTGAFSGSGMMLRYTGETSTLSSTPGIMVALAAPPYYAGVKMNLGSTYTGYGISSSQSMSETTSIGTTNSWGVSLEAKFDFGDTGGWHGGFGTKFGIECEDEFTNSNTIINTTTIASKYVSGASDDGVIFQISTYDQYRYEVVAHPNSTWVGTFLNFQIPRPPLLYKTTVSYFTRAYPNAPKIDIETFGHTVGRPWTYMSLAQVNALPHKWASSWQTVGLGDGANSVEIEVATESSSEVSHSWSSTYSVGGSVSGGFGFLTLTAEGEYTWGTTNEKNFGSTMGDGVTFEGSVGDMTNENDYVLLNFTYGLFAYHLVRGNVSYLVLDYYVEGAKEYYAFSSDTFFSSVPSVATVLTSAAVPAQAIVSKFRRKR